MDKPRIRRRLRMTCLGPGGPTRTLDWVLTWWTPIPGLADDALQIRSYESFATAASAAKAVYWDTREAQEFLFGRNDA